eukprot:gene15900-17500_t
MGLPAKLTEEEQALLDKYAFMKKRKKELQQKQAAVSSESVKVASSVKKAEGKEIHRAPSDAKELAKRKILSGELKIKRDNEHREFKRARSHLEKKLENEKPIGKNDDISAMDRKQNVEKLQPRNSNRNYHESFVAGGLLKEASSDYPDHNRPRFEKQRKRIFVSGFGLTENILQNCFTKFGTILNVHPELERGQGFITFQTHEAAEKAIAEMHGDMVENVNLKVCMAGRPNRGDNYPDRRSFDGRGERESHPVQRFSSQDSPLTPPEKNSQPCDKRGLVTYSDEFDF